MAGRPRTKANHVECLAAEQYALNDALFEECPPMYLDGTNRHDPLAMSWRSAIEAAANAWRAINELHQLLAARAESADVRQHRAVSCKL